MCFGILQVAVGAVRFQRSTFIPSHSPVIGCCRRQSRAPARRARASFWCSSEQAGSDTVARLNNWLQDQGILDASTIRVTNSSLGGLGLEAQEALKAGQVAIDVPRHSVIAEACWSDGIEADAACRVQALVYDTFAWGGAGGLEAGDVLLALRLLHELGLGAASNFEPYITSLPRDLSDSPLQWDAEEIDRLLGPMLMAQDALALKRAVDSSFALLNVSFQIMPSAFPTQTFNPRNFEWAVGIIISRSYPASDFIDTVVAGVVRCQVVCHVECGR